MRKMIIKFSKKKNIIVKKSIEAYVYKYQLDKKKLSEHLMSKVCSKYFLFFKHGAFSIDFVNSLSFSNLTRLKVTSNTLIYSTENPCYNIACLLRWKNHKGVLFPAWQIKLIQP